MAPSWVPRRSFRCSTVNKATNWPGFEKRGCRVRDRCVADIKWLQLDLKKDRVIVFDKMWPVKLEQVSAVSAVVFGIFELIKQVLNLLPGLVAGKFGCLSARHLSKVRGARKQ